MTVLQWDQPGDRKYETGVDRGVLYIPDGPAVPWNGLTQITEKVSRELKSFYTDGVKYLDQSVPGAYAATLEAFTYPDELEQLLGTAKYAPGVNLHDQRAKPFHLCYRTGLGNDLVGLERGYRLHVVYNVTASFSDRASTTAGGPVNMQPFVFNLAGVPSTMFGARPTTHVSLVTDELDGPMLEFVENMLYGTGVSNPYLLPMVDFLHLFAP